MRKFIPILAILSLTGCGFEIVDTGNRGVETTFGEVVGEPLSEGMHFYNPFTSAITEMSVRTQVTTEEAIAYTKDVQKAQVKYSVNYNLDPSAVLNIYKTVGEYWEQKLVAQAVPSIMKNVIGKWEAVELVANRGKATSEIEKNLAESLAAQGVIVSRFEITSIDYDDAFEKAVEAKVVAIQKAAEAENRTKQVAEEAKQQLLTAEAFAKGMKIKSDALAQNKSLVDYEAVQKWDGRLPQYMLGNSIPVINLGSLNKGMAATAAQEVN